MSIRAQLSAGFIVLITIFVLDFFANRRLSDQVALNTVYISNSENIIRNSSILHKNMIEMQSGFRGFLLTGQKSFLDPYYTGIKSIPPLLKNQRALLESRGQQILLDSISKLHHEWVEYADSLITSKLDTSQLAAKRYENLFEKKLKMEVGKRLNDHIRSLFSEFDNNEYAVRQKRRTALQASLHTTRNISVLLTVISILLAVLSSFYFVRTITGRIGKMVKLAEEIAQGDFKTIEDSKSDELNQLAVSLSTMSTTLEKTFSEITKKNRELDQFAYVVSHDLKAPLRGISNIISWMEEDHDELSPALRKDLVRIKGRTTRLENMINGLLDYARIGKVRPGKEQVDLQKLFNELRDLVVPANFIVETPRPLPVLHTEKVHITQVFSNLLSNAVKYNDKEQGIITVLWKQFPGFYEFAVCDNGQGIEAEYFEKIFMIFQTLKERDAFESTGVGLAIVRKIIDDHKGTISVQSEPGKGSKFIFTWPTES